MKRNKILKFLLVVLIFIIMFLAIISSVDNGSPMGDYLKKSGILVNIKRKFNNIIEEALNIKVAPVPNSGVKGVKKGRLR